MAHAIFAPSSAATWMPCPYSARHSVPEPPKPPRTLAASTEGTRGHALMAAAVQDAEWPEEGDTKAEAVAQGVAFINQFEPGELFVEVKGEVAPECGGTADLFNRPYNPRDTVTVMDNKFGKWDVDAYHNMQMMTYAAMFLAYVAAEWWRLVIFQPNGLDEMPFKQWVAHRSEIELHRQRVLIAINDRSPPKPGPHCRWCKAFQQCPAMSNDANFVVGAMSRDPMTLTPDELVRLLRLIRALGDMKDVYEEVLSTRLKLGYKADGATLKPGRKWRAWNDATQAAGVLYNAFGPQGVKPVSPAQAEKLGLAGKQYAAIGAHKPEAELKAHY